MTTIKTAISIDALLFQRAEALAAELHVSRSRLFVLALEEYIKRLQNQQLFDALNEVYSEPPDEEDLAIRQAMRKKYRQNVEEEW